MVAVAIGALLLVAPFAPPQAGIFGFIAILLIGTTGYFVVSMTLNILYDTADEVLPELPEEYEEYPVDDETMEAYVEGEMTDEEFEQVVEEELEKETEA